MDYFPAAVAFTGAPVESLFTPSLSIQSHPSGQLRALSCLIHVISTLSPLILVAMETQSGQKTRTGSRDHRIPVSLRMSANAEGYGELSLVFIESKPLVQQLGLALYFAARGSAVG